MALARYETKGPILLLGWLLCSSSMSANPLTAVICEVMCTQQLLGGVKSIEAFLYVEKGAESTQVHSKRQNHAIIFVLGLALHGNYDQGASAKASNVHFFLDLANLLIDQRLADSFGGDRLRAPAVMHASLLYGSTSGAIGCNDQRIWLFQESRNQRMCSASARPLPICCTLCCVTSRSSVPSSTCASAGVFQEGCTAGGCCCSYRGSTCPSADTRHPGAKRTKDDMPTVLWSVHRPAYMTTVIKTESHSAQASSTPCSMVDEQSLNCCDVHVDEAAWRLTFLKAR